MSFFASGAGSASGSPSWAISSYSRSRHHDTDRNVVFIPSIIVILGTVMVVSLVVAFVVLVISAHLVSVSGRVLSELQPGYGPLPFFGEVEVSILIQNGLNNRLILFLVDATWMLMVFAPNMICRENSLVYPAQGFLSFCLFLNVIMWIYAYLGFPEH
jgi:hypothetical protein